ncbi:hypothetical protein ACFUCH_12120 [Streptomyces olivaceus]
MFEVAEMEWPWSWIRRSHATDALDADELAALGVLPEEALVMPLDEMAR